MPSDEPKLIVGAALGNCAHVAGVANFLRLAEAAGFRTRLLGAAVGVRRILDFVRAERPAVLAIGYRLTASGGKKLLTELLEGLVEAPDVKLLFGGTPEMAELAQKTGRFEACFVGDEPAGRAPLEAIGTALGMPMTLTTACIDRACAALGEDLRAAGRNAAMLGIEGGNSADDVVSTIGGR